MYYSDCCLLLIRKWFALIQIVLVAVNKDMAVFFNQSCYQYFNKTRLQNYKNKLIGRGTPSGKGRDHPSRRAKKSLVRECLSFIGNTTLEWICPRCFAARKTDLCATNHTLLLSDDNMISSAGNPVCSVQLLSQHFHVVTYLQIGNPRINLSGSDVGMT